MLIWFKSFSFDKIDFSSEDNSNCRPFNFSKHSFVKRLFGKDSSRNLILQFKWCICLLILVLSLRKVSKKVFVSVDHSDRISSSSSQLLSGISFADLKLLPRTITPRVNTIIILNYF